MDSIILVNLETKIKHTIVGGTFDIGRGWLGVSERKKMKKYDQKLEIKMFFFVSISVRIGQFLARMAFCVSSMQIL